MNSKVYINDSCSKLEAKWEGLDTIEIPFLATHFVNPKWNNLVGKTIIITLPIKLELERLTTFNRVISRFPLKVDGKELKYEFIPYEVTDSSKISSNYSNRILNKYLLTSEDVDLSSEERFILGTEPETNGYLNMIGYLLMLNN